MKSSSVYLLTAQDCALLDRYKLIVDAIGQVFGNSCECVLHSLADLEHSVIHIHNGMKTGRVLGSPITDKALMLLKNCESLHQDITPVYQTVARNGSPMRSTTIIIRN
ncbi:PAS domain-containing protein, partial [Sutterella wadsworthensis]